MIRTYTTLLSTVVFCFVILAVGYTFFYRPAIKEVETIQMAAGTTGEYFDEASGMVMSKDTTGERDEEFNVRVPMIRSTPNAELPTIDPSITTYYRFGGEGFAYYPNRSTFAGVDKVGVHEKVVQELGERREDALFILDKAADRQAFLADAGRKINDGDVWNVKIWEIYQFGDTTRVLVRCDCGQDRPMATPFDIDDQVQTVWELWNLKSNGIEPELVERSLRWSHDGRTKNERYANQ